MKDRSHKVIQIYNSWLKLDVPFHSLEHYSESYSFDLCSNSIIMK